MNNTDDKVYASVEEFASMLSISQCMVRRMINLGEIPAFRVRAGGRVYRIPVKQAIETMQKNRVR